MGVIPYVSASFYQKQTLSGSSREQRSSREPARV
jgi:hypothetical protein